MQSKPLIRWAGSKRKLLPQLIVNIPATFNRYVEPFCGSACLFFELPQKNKALLSDINGDLINALKEIKKNKSIREQLIQIPNTADEYYRIRGLDPTQLTNEERAVRFLYLNRYCFNGVYRTNSSGQYNVPRGTKTGDFPSQEVFDAARSRLKNAQINVCDYKKTLSKLKEGDFVYIDPPYSKSGKFTGEYGLGSFGSNDIPSFIKALSELDNKGINFLFSYRACKDTERELKKKYKVQIISVKRHISGFKTSWDESKEILVKNYD